jgi:hypothetical protein
MTEAERLVALDLAEQLYAELTIAWSEAKAYAEDMEQRRKMARDLMSVLRDDGEPR